MLKVRPVYVPVFAPHRVQQTARVGGVFTGAGQVIDRLAFSSVLIVGPAVTGYIIGGAIGALVGGGVGLVIASPILFGISG